MDNNPFRYIDEDIKRYREKRTFFATSMNIALKFVPFKDEKDKKKVAGLIYKITNNKTSLNGKKNAYNKLKETLKPYNEGRLGDYFRINEAFERSSLDSKNSQYKNAVNSVSYNPANALTGFAYDYIEAVKSYEYHLARREKLEKELKKKKDSNAQTESKATSVVEHTTSTPSYTTGAHTSSMEDFASYYGISSKPSREDYRDISREERDKETDRILADTVNNDNYSSLDKDVRIISESYGISYEVNVANALNMKHVESKKYKNVRDLAEYALYNVETYSNFLTMDSTSKKFDLYRKFNMSDNMNKYENMYNKFRAEYASMNENERNEVKAQLRHVYHYCEIFGLDEKDPRMVKPDEVKRVINKNIIKTIASNPVFLDEKEGAMSNQLYLATKFMSVNEMITLYHGIKNRREEMYYEPTNAGDKIRHDEYIKNFNKNLQTIMANIIVRKLNEFNSNSRKQTESEMLDEQLRQTAAIIKGVLHEEPLDDMIKTYSRNEVATKKLSNDLTSTHEAKENANRRVYNMGRLEKTIAKVTGKWGKYQSLMHKGILSQEDQDTLETVFRR